jgi:hypothetical protein
MGTIDRRGVLTISLLAKQAVIKCGGNEADATDIVFKRLASEQARYGVAHKAVRQAIKEKKAAERTERDAQ